MRRVVRFRRAAVTAVLALSVAASGFAAQKCTQASVHDFTLSRSGRLLDANQISAWITNYGVLCRDPETGSAGLTYPAGTQKTLVYTLGLWVAGQVNGEVRTACADYNSEFQPGRILDDGQPDDPDNPGYRVYKIRPGDSADPSSPRYNPDYAEWPVQDGAPVDESGAPLVLGDQTLWWVMNDANPTLHNRTYHSAPLNLEVHGLAWAFADTTSPLGRCFFVQYTLINKGQDPIEDAYVGIYLDPDVGNSTDDGTACDTSLSLTYGYNRSSRDRMYGEKVPAVGLVLLQGPAVPAPGHTAPQFLHPPIQNARTLGMTSNNVYY